MPKFSRWFTAFVCQISSNGSYCRFCVLILVLPCDILHRGLVNGDVANEILWTHRRGWSFAQIS